MVTEVIVRKLNVGDYGVVFEDGYEVPLYFERKSVADLLGTLTRGNERFKRELIRAEESGVKIVLVVEGTLSKVKKGIRYGKVNPLAVVKTVFTLKFGYGLDHHFCKDRNEMADYIVESYCAIGRLRVKGNKKINKGEING